MKANETHSQSGLSASQQERRAFMEKAGKLAAYTPPLMLGLLIPGEHAIASGGYNQNGQGQNQTGQGQNRNGQG